MTLRQKFFNKAVRQIRKQGGPSMSEDEETCAYRGLNNRRCAIGAGIPNSLYEKSMEGKAPRYYFSRESLRNDVTNVLVKLGFSTEEDINFLQELQRCHDAYAYAYQGESFMSMFENAIVNFAEKWNLKIPPTA